MDLLAAAAAVEKAANPTATTKATAFTPGFGAIPEAYGWDAFQASTEQLAQLRWPNSIATYDMMRNDAQISGLLSSIFLPIRHLDWYIEQGEADDQITQEIADMLGLPIGDDLRDDQGDFDWDEHLRLALLALVYGHYFFEQNLDTERLTVGGQRWWLNGLIEVTPRSLVGGRVAVNLDGSLMGVRQRWMDIGDMIPADRLASYVWDREGADWLGRSMLRPLYRHWLLKDDALRTGGVSIRRNGMGLPVAEATQPGVSEAQHQAAAQMAQFARAGDTAGVSMPYGTTLRFKGVEGALPDTIGFIRYQDEQMSRAFLQMFADLGKTQTGSRALGHTLMDHYQLGLYAVAGWLAKSTQPLIRRLVTYNHGDVPLPRITFRVDETQDLAVADLVSLIDAGAVVVDDDLEESIRERSNLPPRNPSEPGRTPPTLAKVAQLSAAAAADTTSVPEPGSPADLAQTDFEELQAAHQSAAQHLEVMWEGVQAAQIEDLAAQIAAATTLAQVIAIAAPVLGAAQLAAVGHQVTDHGALAAQAEAEAQGVTIALPDLSAARDTIAEAASAKATLLAQSLSQAAASKAATTFNALGPEKTAEQVAAYLTGLSGATPSYEIAGLVSHAQNEGRFVVMDHAPAGTTFYASELNDANTCTLCAGEDSTEFPSMTEARRDYPAGGFVGCEGGQRCRGTIVAVYPETPGQSVAAAAGPSRQRVYGGGKFKSERQRRFMWAVVPGAAKKWAHNRKTRKPDWRGARFSRARHR